MGKSKKKKVKVKKVKVISSNILIFGDVKVKETVLSDGSSKVEVV